MTPDLILLLALGALVFYMFWSSRKRKAAAEALMNSLEVGSEVLLHSGIYAKIVEIDENVLIVESTPGTKFKVVKQAVRTVEPVKTTENDSEAE